ncbi:hypothetical protein [Streptomyces cyaneofuscatus]
MAEGVVMVRRYVNVSSQAVANGSPVGLGACGTGANARWKRS